MTTALDAKDKIILPLDVSDESEARKLIERLAGAVTFYKIGLELFTRCGPEGVHRIRQTIQASAGGVGRIFLDLKFHDIPNTVAGAVRSAAELQPDMLTVHLSGGRAMLLAAASQISSKTLLLGVSVLTSSDETTLLETGVHGPVAEQVLRLARLGFGCGLRGVVASPREVHTLRAEFGTALTIVTPGVRPTWAAGDDQRRVLTPGEATRAGADFLVIGRPITGHPNPAEAARRIGEEMTAALVPA